jgi:hypothetical protein
MGFARILDSIATHLEHGFPPSESIYHFVLLCSAANVTIPAALTSRHILSFLPPYLTARGTSHCFAASRYFKAYVSPHPLRHPCWKRVEFMFIPMRKMRQTVPSLAFQALVAVLQTQTLPVQPPLISSKGCALHRHLPRGDSNGRPSSLAGTSSKGLEILTFRRFTDNNNNNDLKVLLSYFLLDHYDFQHLQPRRHVGTNSHQTSDHRLGRRLRLRSY